MGLQFQFQTVKARTSKMKAIILLFALAAVNAAPDSEAKPWWNTYGNTYGWNGMTAWNGWYPRAAAYGYWKRGLIPRPSPGGLMPTPMAGTACTTAGTTCTQGLLPTECGRGTPRLILRPSPG